MFRGSEFPRLLLLAGIVLAGWPMVLLFAHPQEGDPPPPPSVPVERITKVVPDESVEFQAIQDKDFVLPRESAAYATLLQRTRETPPKELGSQARRDVFWTQLWERPQAYRAVPIHLEGTVKKVLTYEVGPAMSPRGRLHDVWFYSDENRSFPYVVVVEDPPPGLVVGYELNLRASFDAYFLKLLKYQAGDTARAAPMLVGRMTLAARQAEPPGPMVEIRDFTQRNGLSLLIGALLGYVTLRLVFQIRKALRPAQVLSAFRTTGAALPPEELADWLRNLPEHVAETETQVDGEDPPPHPGPRTEDDR